MFYSGTAINLVVQNMPRLSVDIEVVYLPCQVPREEALQAINQELAAIATRPTPLGIQTRLAAIFKVVVASAVLQQGGIHAGTNVEKGGDRP